MTVFERLNRDEEIRSMINFIHEKTGEWEGLYIFQGETIEKCRERLRKQVEYLKRNDNTYNQD